MTNITKENNFLANDNSLTTTNITIAPKRELKTKWQTFSQLLTLLEYGDLIEFNRSQYKVKGIY